MYLRNLQNQFIYASSDFKRLILNLIINGVGIKCNSTIMVANSYIGSTWVDIKSAMFLVII